MPVKVQIHRGALFVGRGAGIGPGGLTGLPLASSACARALPGRRQGWQDCPVLRLQVDPHKCPIAAHTKLYYPANAQNPIQQQPATPPSRQNRQNVALLHPLTKTAPQAYLREKLRETRRKPAGGSENACGTQRSEPAISD